jgi:hypothetical protein
MDLSELKPEELRNILRASGADPHHSAAQDPERLRTILGLLETAGLLRIQVTSQSIRLSMPASAAQLVLPRVDGTS